ncbi:hypothetical protein Q5P01_015189 [Channa striata]|uniref:Uncharacterized protein n=1 Tax=Channa striata TaxID=64152 RepID=A0AA88MK59_CHASR|nr:hypothetical protein Q5P01_015189 [Channa striata]
MKAAERPQIPQLSVTAQKHWTEHNSRDTTERFKDSAIIKGTCAARLRGKDSRTTLAGNSLAATPGKQPQGGRQKGKAQKNLREVVSGRRQTGEYKKLLQP